MLFVELPSFREFADQHWTDDELRRLQATLIVRPDTGALIPGARGLRKLRWALTGRGKQGGARVIYYWLARDERIYLVHAYAKGATADLTKHQIRVLAKLMKDEIAE